MGRGEIGWPVFIPCIKAFCFAIVYDRNRIFFFPCPTVAYRLRLYLTHFPLWWSIKAGEGIHHSDSPTKRAAENNSAHCQFSFALRTLTSWDYTSYKREERGFRRRQDGSAAIWSALDMSGLHDGQTRHTRNFLAPQATRLDPNVPPERQLTKCKERAANLVRDWMAAHSWIFLKLNLLFLPWD